MEYERIKEKAEWQQGCPKTWLTESILVTIFCCLPFGIAGIVNASKVREQYDAGNFIQAQISSENAAKWTRIGFWLGLVFGSIYLFIQLGARGGRF